MGAPDLGAAQQIISQFLPTLTELKLGQYLIENPKPVQACEQDGAQLQKINAGYWRGSRAISPADCNRPI
jgi:hypothetical protein